YQVSIVAHSSKAYLSDQFLGDSFCVEVFVGDASRCLAMPWVIAVDRIDGRQCFFGVVESEKAFSGWQNVAEAGVLGNDRLATSQIASITLAEPSAPKADILIFSDGELGA